MSTPDMGTAGVENLAAGQDQPATQANRFVSLDVLRGFAVLAILAVNIKGTAVPFAYYMNASLWPGQFDMLVATIQAFLIDDKWRTIFTGLFGAGMVLIADKSMANGVNPMKRLRIRLFWLLIFGLMHLILIWPGDILTSYAIAGFLALFFVKRRTGTQLGWAIGLFLFSWAWISLYNIGMLSQPEIRSEVEPLMWGTDAEALQKQIDTALGPISAQISGRAYDAIGAIFGYFLLGGYWVQTISIMLFGMVLWRSGFLAARSSNLTYIISMLIGFGAAIGTDFYRWSQLHESGWTFEMFNHMIVVNTLNGPAGALGYSALIMFLVKQGIGFTPFARAGQMAFTNYIASSLIMTTIFYGHGLGLFNQLTLLQLVPIVFAIWVALLLFSWIWLSIFRFGPLEWLWRSLTYGRIQKLLK